MTEYKTMVFPVYVVTNTVFSFAAAKAINLLVYEMNYRYGYSYL